jgi:DNA-directed RNA polymerase subunit beta'
MSALAELNKLMPADIQFHPSDEPLTKPVMNSKLSEFARKYPTMYARNIHKIRELGEELAYLGGHNIGPNDLNLSNEKHIESFLKKEGDKVARMPDDVAKTHLVHVFDKLQDLTMKNDNNLTSQAKSKGRGNPATATRVVSGVVYAVDMNSEPYPFMIKNSLAKGLSSHEQFASGGQARFSAVQSAVSTAEPGAMGKTLVANTESIKIVEKDCGTKNGVMTSTDTNDAVGRYEAGTNKLIDEQYLKLLRQRGKKKVKVRSPITCQAKHGICSMCMGVSSSGAPHPIGHNIGIESAQTISEKSIQLVLSTKHNVTGKKANPIPTGFKAQKILLGSTEKYPGKALVAKTSGTVKSITKLHTGGYNINVGGIEHSISGAVSPKVSVGTHVDKGAVLTNGIASTKDILETRGVTEARKYLSDELDKANNHTIDKRHFEVFARGYLNLVKPATDKGNTNLRTYDEFVPTLSGTHMTTMKTSDRQITKKFLAEPALHYSIGSQITNSIAKDLHKNGVKSVKVSHSPIGYTPVFKTYEQRPQFGKSMWEQLNYRGLKKSIGENLLYGEKENIRHLRSDRAKIGLGIL